MQPLSDIDPQDPVRILEAVRRLTSAPPPAGSWRVLVGGQPCGWARPAVAQALAKCAKLEPSGRRLLLEAGNAALASIAHTLRAAGQLKGWRDELLDVVTAEGARVGAIERAAMRPLGFTTHAVHLNALDAAGNLWIARRALHKNTDPGLWDTLVGGLVASGEAPHAALLRESNEEAGLEPADLTHTREAGQFVVTRSVPEGYQVEATFVTECVLPASTVPRNRDGEVEEIRTASWPEVMRMIVNGEFTAEAALSILVSKVPGAGTSVAGAPGVEGIPRSGTQ